MEREKGKFRSAVFVVFIAILICLMPNNLAAEGKKLVFGYTPTDMEHTFQIRTCDAVVAAANQFGIDVVVLDPRSDVASQADCLDQFISRKVDVIMIASISAEASVPAIKKALNAGIPVLTVLNAVKGIDVPYVGSDFVNGAGAGLLAETVAKTLGEKGNILYIKGGPGFLVTDNRDKGFKEVMKKYPDIKIVFEQFGDWLRGSGVKLTEDALARFPKKGQITAIVAHNDDMALGAVQALARAGRTDILVFGIDGTEDALTAIKNGKMAASAYQCAEAIGTYGTITAIRMLLGQKPPLKSNVPWVIINSENVGTYMDIEKTIKIGWKYFADARPF
jgi:ABC-type sugar transport system substrate-binding protein